MTDTAAPAAMRRETPAEAAVAMMRALQYLEREARQAGLHDLAETISGAVAVAAAATTRDLVQH